MSGVGAQRGGHVHEAVYYGLFGRKEKTEKCTFICHWPELDLKYQAFDLVCTEV